MDTNKKNREKTVDVTIRPNDGSKWSAEKTEAITAMAKLRHGERSKERLLQNAMAAVRYKMEDYVNDEDVMPETILTIEDFVKDFLKVLGLKKGEFAKHIDIDDSNLNKYYRNDRRFNTVLALKFAHFFHTPADLWLKVQIKNELLELHREQEATEKYSKYDYKKVLQMA